jgi:hypothetical protein
LEKMFSYKIEKLPIEKEIFEEKEELREIKNDIKEVKAEIKLAQKKRKYTKKVKKGKIIISEEVEPLQEFLDKK